MKIAQTLIESFDYVSEAADPAKVNRFIQLVNSGQFSSELYDLENQLRPEMFSSDALSKAFTKLNANMIDKMAQKQQRQGKPVAGAKPQANPVPGAKPAAAAKPQAKPAPGAKPAPTTADADKKQFLNLTGKMAATKPAATPGGGTQAAKPAAHPDDLPPIADVNQPPKPLVNTSQTADVIAAVSKLPPQQIADLHNKLKASEKNLGITDKRWWTTPLDYKSNLSMEPSAGVMTPELKTLIANNKTDVIGYVKGMTNVRK